MSFFLHRVLGVELRLSGSAAGTAPAEPALWSTVLLLLLSISDKIFNLYPRLISNSVLLFQLPEFFAYWYVSSYPAKFMLSMFDPECK